VRRQKPISLGRRPHAVTVLQRGYRQDARSCSPGAASPGTARGWGPASGATEVDTVDKAVPPVRLTMQSANVNHRPRRCCLCLCGIVLAFILESLDTRSH